MPRSAPPASDADADRRQPPPEPPPRSRRPRSPRPRSRPPRSRRSPGRPRPRRRRPPPRRRPSYRRPPLRFPCRRRRRGPSHRRRPLPRPCPARHARHDHGHGRRAAGAARSARGRDGRRRGGAEAPPRRARGAPAARADPQGLQERLLRAHPPDDRLADPLRRAGDGRADDHVRPGRAAVRGVRGLGQVGDRPERQAGRPGRRAGASSGRTRPTPPSARPRRAGSSGPGRGPPKIVGIAKLYIPRLDKHWVVVEGVTPAGHPVRPRPLPRHRAARQGRQLLRRRAPQPGHLLGPRRAASRATRSSSRPRQNWYVYRVVQNRGRQAHPGRGGGAGARRARRDARRRRC